MRAFHCAPEVPLSPRSHERGSVEASWSSVYVVSDRDFRSASHRAPRTQSPDYSDLLHLPLNCREDEKCSRKMEQKFFTDELHSGEDY